MLQKTFQTLILIAVLFITACSSNDDPAPDNTNNNNTNPINTPTSCDSPDTEDMSGAIMVGDGTAASCTETALANAIATGGKIQCNCGSSETVINITSEIVIDKDVILDGASNVVLDGGNSTRIFLKESGANFTIQNITLRNAKAPTEIAFSFDECGGAILAKGNDTGQAVGGNFTANKVTFENCSTGSLDENDVAGGAVYVFNVPESKFIACSFINNQSSNGGAIGNLGSDLILINSVFQNNSALGTSGHLTGHGGAINIDGISLSGTNKVYSACGCIFSGNTATKQGGASNSVISDGKNSSVTFDKCSFENNTVGNNEDGQGGAIFHIEDDNIGASNEDNFFLLNSTFTGNEAGKTGGGLWLIIDGKGYISNCTFEGGQVKKPAGSLGGAIAFSSAGYGGNYQLTNNTFANNHSGHFAGAVFVANQNTANFVNCIFANNTSDFEWEGHQLAGPGTYTGSNNLQFPEKRPNDTNDNEVPGRISTADPLLQDLADNGGATKTMALQTGSPAIDAGTSSNAPTTDQRGETRDDSPDIGAYELK